LGRDSLGIGKVDVCTGEVFAFTNFRPVALQAPSHGGTRSKVAFGVFTDYDLSRFEAPSGQARIWLAIRTNGRSSAAANSANHAPLIDQSDDGAVSAGYRTNAFDSFGEDRRDGSPGFVPVYLAVEFAEARISFVRLRICLTWSRDTLIRGVSS